MVMQGIGETYLQGTQNRLTRQTCLRSIFADCPVQWRDIPVMDFFDRGQREHALYSVLLSASAGEQIDFLTATYDEMYPDVEVKLAFKAIVYRQRLLDFIDWRSAAHRERVVLVYLGVKEARRK